MIDYAMVRNVHRTFVILSVSGFAVRGMASLIGLRWVRMGAARFAPHVVDTLLLASALLMLWMGRPSALHERWLWAKMAGLLVYIGLGAVALGSTQPDGVRAGALAGALLTVGWMASVAVMKEPLGFLRLLSSMAG